jgi:hypothetical protein
MGVGISDDFWGTTVDLVQDLLDISARTRSVGFMFFPKEMKLSLIAQKSKGFFHATFRY